MKKSLKAALFSGLVMPGVGQIILKNYKKGILFISTTLICLSYIMVEATKQATLIVDKIVSGEIEMTESAITAAITNASQGAGKPIYTIVITIITACWIISTIDAFISGKKIDEKEKQQNNGNDTNS